MKVIILSEGTVIDGKLYRKGEVVQVDDGFNTNIKRVVVDANTGKAREAASINAVKPITGKPKEKDGNTTK